MKPEPKRHFRAATWWVEWEDLELGNPSIYDKIRRRADSFAAAAVRTLALVATFMPT